MMELQVALAVEGWLSRTLLVEVLAVAFLLLLLLLLQVILCLIS
jgi:hypothetical protein